MDELLTDLKSYDNHKASRREAKAGGRLQGEVEAERSRKLFWAGDVQAEVGSRGSAYGGREGLQEERCGEEHVPIKGQGALHVLARWWEEEEDDEEGGQVQPCSSGEAGRSGAALERTVWHGPSVFLQWKVVRG